MKMALTHTPPCISESAPLSSRISSKKKVRGLALLELLIAIGILGIIAAGVATLASRTFAERNMTQVSRAVTDVTLGVQRSFSRNLTYTNGASGTVTVLAGNGVFDNETATNPFTGAHYGFVPLQKKGIDNKAFGVIISGLTSGECHQIATGGLLGEAKMVVALSDDTVPTENTYDVADQTLGGAVLKSAEHGLAPAATDANLWADFCQGEGSINQVIIGNW